MDRCIGARKSQYDALPETDSDTDLVLPSRSWSLLTGPLLLPERTSVIALLIILASAISTFGGYLVGMRSASEKGETLLQLNRIPVTFEYQFNFAEAPSALTDQQWKSLFPRDGGFFEHPAFGSKPVGFSVFHQLHCLDGIRNAYWTVRNGNHSKEGNSHPAEHSSDIHVRHCLEYIRQGLICSADTTVEPTERDVEGNLGVRGFGTQHVCRDFNQLVQWTSRWEREEKSRTT